MKGFALIGNNAPVCWRRTQLEECVDILDSKRVPINAKEREARIEGKNPAELIPYYGATGQVGWIDDCIFDEELLLLGEDGAPFLDPFKAKAYLIRGKTWVNNHAHVLRALTGLTSNSYLCHYLNSFKFRDYISGTTRHKLNQKPMRQIPVPVAPLAEQHQIVGKVEELFTRLDAGVEALKKVQAQLRRYRQAVLRDAFTGKLTQEWRERELRKPDSRLLHDSAVARREKVEAERDEQVTRRRMNTREMSAPSLGDLPTSWVWEHLGDLFRWVNGKGLTREQMASGPYPVYGGNGISGNHSSFLCEHRTIVIGRVGAHCGNVHVADPPLWVTDNAIYASWASKNACVSFYKYCLENMRLNTLAGGSGQPYVSQRILNPLVVPMPALVEQHHIVAEIDRHFSVADAIEQSIEQTLKQSERLRQSILKRAFEGKLTERWRQKHPELVTGENSAEKLLERIKAEKARLEGEQKAARKKATRKSPKNGTAKRRKGHK